MKDANLTVQGHDPSIIQKGVAGIKTLRWFHRLSTLFKASAKNARLSWFNPEKSIGCFRPWWKFRIIWATIERLDSVANRLSTWLKRFSLDSFLNTRNGLFNSNFISFTSCSPYKTVKCHRSRYLLDQIGLLGGSLRPTIHSNRASLISRIGHHDTILRKFSPQTEHFDTVRWEWRAFHLIGWLGLSWPRKEALSIDFFLTFHHTLFKVRNTFAAMICLQSILAFRQRTL